MNKKDEDSEARARYGKKQPRLSAPSKETPRMPETIEGEKLLGCIRVTSHPRARIAGEKVLAFTPNRVFVVGFAGGAVFGGGYGEDPVGVVIGAIDLLSGLYARRKSGELLKASVEEFLKADKNSFVIPNSEIREVELKKGWLTGVKLDITMNKKKYEWGRLYEKHRWNVVGLIPEKKDAKVEDYENILRPAFGDKLSVKTRARKLKKRKEAVAWQLEDQLKELDEQLSLGHVTQEEYEQKKKKLLEKSES